MKVTSRHDIILFSHTECQSYETESLKQLSSETTIRYLTGETLQVHYLVFVNLIQQQHENKQQIVGASEASPRCQLVQHINVSSTAGSLDHMPNLEATQPFRGKTSKDNRCEARAHELTFSPQKATILHTSLTT